jgi:hypothetical protein
MFDLIAMFKPLDIENDSVTLMGPSPTRPESKSEAELNLLLTKSSVLLILLHNIKKLQGSWKGARLMGSPKNHLLKVEADLQHGEVIQASVEGTVTLTKTSTSSSIRGILVLTDRRFIFSGGAWGTKDSHSVPLSGVTSIDLHKNLMTAHIQVTAAGNTSRYLVKYKEAEPFVKTAHDVLATAHNSTQATIPLGSPAEEITKLAALYAQGLLSDEEFAAAKSKALQ